MSVFSTGCPRLFDAEPGSYPGLDGQDPLEGVRWSTVFGHSLGEKTLVFGWTPPETALIEMTVNEEPATDAVLSGPFPELHTDRRLWVATWPRRVDDPGPISVRYQAYDPDGRILWQEVDRHP
jgi:hypothetical protein